MMTRVVLKDVNKFYGKNHILHNIDLEINNEEFCVLVGPSGSGKSTLLRLIAGFERPTSGTITFDDEIVNNVPPGDRDLGMVFQNYALFANLSVFDNIGFGLKIRKTPRDIIKEKVAEVAKMFKIDGKLDRYPRELSGGERQRVALGRAVIRNPGLLLMDEPLSNLDALLRVQTRTEIVRNAKELKSTVIYVTHDQTEALSMSDKLVVLKDGKIQQIGTAAEVYQYPANEFVATFFGSPSMNLIRDLTVSARNDRAELMNEVIQYQTSDHMLFEGITKVTMGVRPEDIVLKGEQDWPQIEGKIVHIENLGSEQLVFLEKGEQKIVFRVGPDEKVSPVESVVVYLKPKKLHFFDPQTGLRITGDNV